ncbi:hypothetical protein [Spirosoma oryzicola]|uniref:hypothetical protein n=1 Tax=Spirosoma oryzicola TaxID=2898794 RepID=UPI001E446F09|nr:hypothetical protein [Spirosoma oryzicola]UHG92924.1 hypothetical protein LQ777_08475 [Spirosoma oryzicola]
MMSSGAWCRQVRGVGGAARAVLKTDPWRQQSVSVSQNRLHAGCPADTTEKSTPQKASVTTEQEFQADQGTPP